MQNALQESQHARKALQQQVAGLNQDLTVVKTQGAELESQIQMMNDQFQKQLYAQDAKMAQERNRFEMEETKLRQHISSMARSGDSMREQVKNLSHGQETLRNLLADTHLSSTQQTQRLIQQANERSRNQPLLTGESRLVPAKMS
jgi:predicted  nucleic acid-binding Zn-ribbon protein